MGAADRRRLMISGGAAGVPSTWNLLDKSSNVVLSNGDLTASNTTAGWSGVRGVLGKNSGTASFEYTYDSGLSPHYAVPGVANSEFFLGNVSATSHQAYAFNNTIGDVQRFHSTGPTTIYNGTTVVIPGDVVRIECNFDSHTIEFFINNVSQGGTHTIDSDTFYPYTHIYQVRHVTINCGQSAFVNSPTAGITEGWFE